MCQKLSALNAIGYVFLIVSTLACCLCFAAPFWVVYPHAFKVWKVESPAKSLAPELKNSIGVAWKGMLAQCYADLQCTWYWENDYDLEKSLQEWYMTSQSSMMCAVSALILALLLQSIYSCCRCCKKPCRFPTVIASFTVTGSILAGLGLALFVAFAYKDGWFDQAYTGGYIAKLEWAFYVGVGGAAGSFIAALLFFCDGCCLKKTYREYSPPPKS